MMENDHYKDRLVEAIKELAEFRETIFLSIFNLAMAGELKEWNESVEIGETYKFTSEIFEGCSDINIQLLINLLITVESTINSICNLNCIKI